jgi:hypothetical protein
MNALVIAIILIALQGFKTELPTVDPDAPKPEPPTTPPDACSPTQGYYEYMGGKVKMASAAPDSQDGKSTPVGEAFRGSGGANVFLRTASATKKPWGIKIGPFKWEKYTTGDCA